MSEQNKTSKPAARLNNSASARLVRGASVKTLNESASAKPIKSGDTQAIGKPKDK